MAKRKGSRSHTYESIDEWLDSQSGQDRRTLRSSLTRLQRLYRNRPERNDLTWHHRLGSQVLAFFPEEQSRYGDNVIELLANHLQPGREKKDKQVCNFLYQARDFARAYNSRGAVRLANAGNAEGNPLSMSHVTALLCEEDEGKRQRFLKRCLGQSWCVRDLRQAIQNAKGRKRGGGGRRPKRPKRQNAGVALQNISLMSRDWMRNHEVWFEEPSCPFGEIRKKDCSEAILKEAQSAIQELERVRGATRDGLKQIKSFVRRLRERLPT